MLVSSYDMCIDKEQTMETVTVSPKYQIVIPKSIREQMGIKPGEQLDVVYYNGTVRLIRVPTIEEMRGAFPDIDTHIDREPDRF